MRQVVTLEMFVDIHNLMVCVESLAWPCLCDRTVCELKLLEKESFFKGSQEKFNKIKSQHECSLLTETLQRTAVLNGNVIRLAGIS